MKKILIGLGAVLALLVIAAFVVPMLVPVDAYKGRVLAAIHDATGREARIDGDFGFSIIPNVEFTAGKVSLANAKGASPANMVTLDKLKVRVALLPLLSGQVQIDSFVLEKPVIALSVEKNGVPNWQFAKTKAPAKPAPAKPAPAAKPAPGGGGPSMLKGLTLGDVRIVNGKVSYADARTGKSYTLDDVNMKVALPSLSSPMQLDGSLVWNKEKIALALHADNPNALLNGEASPVQASVQSNPVKFTFKGSLANGKAIKAHGAIDLSVPSVRKLAAWAGSPLNAPGSGFGPLSVTGTVDMDGKKLSFTDAKMALDAIKGTGAVHYDGGHAKPYVNAKLAVETLDLNPYLPPEGASSAAPSKSGGAPGGTAPAAKNAPAAEAGWSDKPLDFSALKQADADFDFTLGGLVMRKIKIGKSHMTASLKNGRLVADLTEMALYDGKGTAKVTADDAGRSPAVGLAFDLKGVKANPFLSDAIGLDRLEGTANANLDVKGNGRSERAIVSSLDGKGAMAFRDGAIRGINLAAMVRNVKSAFLNPNATQTEKTDFSELSGTYVIRNGILTNNDLTLLSPLLRVAGKGTVNLPTRTVNYRVEPKLVASTTGQGGKTGIAGLMVPVKVTGPWNHLSYEPDLAAAVSGAAKGKALQELQKVLPGAKSGSSSGGSSQVPDVGGALKGLFGK